MSADDFDAKFRSALHPGSDDLKPLEKFLEQNPTLDISTFVFNNMAYAYKDVLFEEMSPLHLACIKNSPEVVAFLLRKSLLQKPSGPSRCTPIHVAAVYNNLEVCRVLLGSLETREDRKKCVNSRMLDGRTTLHLAAIANSPELVKYLVEEAGANLDTEDCRGYTAFHEASRNNSCKALQELHSINRAGISRTDHKGRTCLHLAAGRGLEDTTRWLLSEMSLDDIKTKDEDGRTAWDMAIRDGSIEAMSPFIHKEEIQRDSANRLISCDGSEFHFRGNKILKLRAFNMNNKPFIMAELKSSLSSNIFERFVQDYIQHEREFTDREDPEICLIRYREPSCTFDIPSQSVSLVMPFFHFQSLAEVQHWRGKDKRVSSFKQITDGWKYCCSEHSKSYGVYLPLTLDEYCCPALPTDVLNRRNEDQVLSRRKEGAIYKDTCEEQEKLKILSVSQFWLWKAETRDYDFLLISPGNGTQLSGNQLKPIHVPLDGRTSRNSRTGDVNRRIGLILSHLLSYLEDPGQAKVVSRNYAFRRFIGHPSGRVPEPILNGYEKAISDISEVVNKYLKDMTIEKIDGKKEKEMIHIIGDIREELSMIKRVLLHQEEVWREFAFNVWPEHWPSGQDGRMIIGRDKAEKFSAEEAEEWRIVLQPQSQFGKYRRRLEQLDEDAERVERSIAAKLDLMAKHATLREAHAAAIMSAAVFGFTFITIIFTPLSFFTSLFALPIDKFQNQQMAGRFSSETGMYRSSYVGKYIAIGEIVSVTVALVAMWAAIRFGMGIRLRSVLIFQPSDVVKTIKEWVITPQTQTPVPPQTQAPVPRKMEEV